MTETDTSAPTTDAPAARKRAGGLSTMLIADLRSMAGGMGITGAGSMKKAQLVEAIKAAQSGGGAARSAPEQPAVERPAAQQPAVEQPAVEQPAVEAPAVEAPAKPEVRRRTRGQDRRAEQKPTDQDQAEQQPEQKQPQQKRPEPAAEPDRAPDRSPREQGAKQDKGQQDKGQQDKGQQDKGQQDKGQQDKGRSQQGKQDQSKKQQQGKQDQNRQDQGAQAKGNQSRQTGNPNTQQGGQNGNQQNGNQQNGNPNNPNNQQDDQDWDDDEAGGRSRNRRRRGRDRNRPVAQTTSGQRGEPDTTVLEDDVLVPAAGILDVLDNYAFVRTTGYLAGTEDVYLSLSMVRRHGLRRGDAVVGEVRQPREGERKEKFNPMVRVESINGLELDAAKERPDFADLTPVHPSERLRLETGPANTVGRVLDLVAPLGKGQRGLVVAPPQSGRTTLLRAVAESVTQNNPECHLMVVLVDERPEEVTDFQRAVKGEVIASTFDRPAADHVALAELAVERAKRLVELGHDVVMLVDGLTRLGRAYNAAGPGSGRVLAGGVDAAALFPPKRFFAAARNVEDGGSLTILATASVETGSATDAVLFEELGGTANLELHLRRDLAERHLTPSVDPLRSRTRREDELMGEQELAVLGTLRSLLAQQEAPRALELLVERVRATQTNIELLTAVQRTGSLGRPASRTAVGK